MKVIVIGCAAFALLIGTLPASANSFRARNTLTVNPITATEFEVVKKASSSPRAMWCAASDFSGRGLGRYKKTDLIIKTPIGPSVTQPGRIGTFFFIVALLFLLITTVSEVLLNWLSRRVSAGVRRV